MNLSLDFVSNERRQQTLRRQFAWAGSALMRKVRDQVEVSGHYQAAKNLRKQGYPLDVALALVVGRF